MTKVHYIKKALKDNPVAKKGEPYYWWKFRFGGKKYSKTPPKPSQLTQSEFLSSVYALQEEMAETKSVDSSSELEDLRSEWVNRIEEIRDCCQEKFDNMPEGLQQGDIGVMLDERISAMDDWISELESVDMPDENSPEDALGEALGNLADISPPL